MKSVLFVFTGPNWLINSFCSRAIGQINWKGIGCSYFSFKKEKYFAVMYWTHLHLCCFDIISAIVYHFHNICNCIILNNIYNWMSAIDVYLQMRYMYLLFCANFFLSWNTWTFTSEVTRTINPLSGNPFMGTEANGYTRIWKPDHTVLFRVSSVLLQAWMPALIWPRYIYKCMLCCQQTQNFWVCWQQSMHSQFLSLLTT